MTRIVDVHPNPVREVEHAWIPLADGTRLAMRYWLPEDAASTPVPALLEYIPYCKRDGTAARDEAMHPWFAGHGYAALRVDLRGSGESGGLLEDEYLAIEQDDAEQVIAWIAAQPWCNGRVGMLGKSWGGFNALQVAARQPPALGCIVTVYSTVDRYADDIHYMGGCLLAENPNWAFTMFPLNARPPDPALVGDGWRETWMRRLQANRPWIIDWLRHQRRDAYWRHGSVCEDYERIRVPVLAVGGWADPYTNAVPALLENLSVPCKGLVGPWGHQYPHQALPTPRVGFLQECLRWFDHWLKDVDNGVADDPSYRVWMQDGVKPAARHEHRPGRWVAEPDWPSARLTPQHWFLSGQGLREVAGDDELLHTVSESAVGLATPFWGDNGGGGPESPLDQRGDDALSLCLDSPPLAERLEILGAPVLELSVGADAPQAFVCARLCELRSDGTSLLVSFGLLNLCRRNGAECNDALRGGERYAVRMALNHIAHAFAAGSRVRLALSSALWPMVWPSPATTTLEIATAGSRLVLPVRPPRAQDESLRVLADAEQARVHATTTLRQAAPVEARLEHDIDSDTLHFVHREDAGRVRNDASGWTFASKVERRYSLRPADPLSACLRFSGCEEYGRDDAAHTRIEVEQSVSCDASHFIVRARLDAFEDERPVFSRSWLERIARDGL